MNPILHLCIWVCDLEYSFSGVRLSLECIYSKPVILFLRVVDRLEPNCFHFSFYFQCLRVNHINNSRYGSLISTTCIGVAKMIMNTGCDLRCVWLNCVNKVWTLISSPPHLSIYKQEGIIRELRVLVNSEIWEEYYLCYSFHLYYKVLTY